MTVFFTLIRILLRIDDRLSGLTALIQRLLEHQQNLSASAGDTWLDNQDVMQKLNISPSTLKRRRLEGIIPYTRIKGKYYYKESDIQALLIRGLGRG